MPKLFYSRPFWLFGNVAVAILCVVFFFVPFAMRGARLSVQEMKNDVRDWLPNDFEETEELQWFGQHFLGEQFVLMTWDGCTASDPAYQLMIEKLAHETQPPPEPPLPGQTPTPEQLRIQEEIRARDIGDKFGLFALHDDHFNWGGLNEKWLQGRNNLQYYITPDGSLYRWRGRTDVIAATVRELQIRTAGYTLQGDFIAKLGRGTPPEAANPFYDDPRKLSARLFKSFYSGPIVLDRLTHPPSADQPGGPLWPRSSESEEVKAARSRELAMERLEGALYAPDHEQTAIIITLTPVAKEELSRVVGRAILGKPRGKLLDLAEECGLYAPKAPTMLPPPISLFFPDEQPGDGQREVRFGGPPVDNVAIDEEGSVTLLRLVSLCAVMGLGLAYLCFRSVRVTFMIFFVGGVSAVMSMGIVWWLGSSPDAVLMTMPALVYVLGLSGSIHLVNYYREQVQQHGKPGAVEKMIGHGWFPCTLAACTTAIGMASLCTSSIVPIWKFGLFSAIGTVATLLLLFTYLPAALYVWAPKWNKLPPLDERIGRVATPGLSGLISAMWMRWAEVVLRYYWPILGACLLILVVSAIGVSQIKTSVQLLKLFDSDSKIIRDYTWLEANLGQLTPIELVVRVPQEMQQPPLETLSAMEQEGTDRDIARELYQLDFLERLEIPDRIQRAAYEAFGPNSAQPIMGPGLSAATFGPELPGPDAGGMFNLRGPMRSLLEENRRQLLETDYFRLEQDTAAELWRISLRVAALADVDYGVFVRKLETIVEPILSAYTTRNRILHALLLEREDTPETPASPSLTRRKVLLLGVNPRNLTPLPRIGEAPQKIVTQADVEALAEAAQAEDAAAAASDGTWSLADWFGSEAISGKNATTADQLRLYSLTLDDLLRNRGFRVGGRRITQQLDWHDPVAQPVSDDPEVQANWQQYLKQFDLVVLVNDTLDGKPIYNRDLIKQAGVPLMDGTRFVHQPGLGERSTPTAAVRMVKQGDRFTTISVTYTGIVPIVYKAQRTLLTSLFESIGQAFVMIALVMMVLLRDWQRPFGPFNSINLMGGLLSMLPNMFPVMLVFGFMAWRGIEVDIGSMMTASVALGIAVDDTIHFLNWYRMGLRMGLPRHDAIRMSYHHVATAMTQTTLVGGLGMSVFVFSTFTPTQRFGLLMLSLLGCALIGDMVFLPALLASPLGRFFGKTATPEEAEKYRMSESDLPAELVDRLESVSLPTSPSRPGDGPNDPPDGSAPASQGPDGSAPGRGEPANDGAGPTNPPDGVSRPRSEAASQERAGGSPDGHAPGQTTPPSASATPGSAESGTASSPHDGNGSGQHRSRGTTPTRRARIDQEHP